MGILIAFNSVGCWFISRRPPPPQEPLRGRDGGSVTSYQIFSVWWLTNFFIIHFYSLARWSSAKRDKKEVRQQTRILKISERRWPTTNSIVAKFNFYSIFSRRKLSSIKFQYCDDSGIRKCDLSTYIESLRDITSDTNLGRLVLCI